jgi:uncharacterized protein YkwD
LKLLVVLEARVWTMKRRWLRKAIPCCLSAVVFAGLLWAATIACTGPDQARRFAELDAAPPPQTQSPTAQKTPNTKLAKSAPWHHFGESDNASVVGQSQQGVWRHFGPNHGTIEVGPGEPLQQNFVSNRMADLEKQMWALVNRERLDPTSFAETGGRAQPLRWNESLAAVARAHSRNMLEQGFFDHSDPGGRTLSGRINEAGIPWRAVGENIAIHATVRGAEAAFMDEPHFQHNHRANILNPNYTDVGIGIVQGPNGSLYITQDFVAIPPKQDGARSAP